MAAHELGLDPRGKRLDQCLGESGIGGAGLPRRERARDHADADEKGLLAADDARAVERLRIIGRLGQRRADQLLQLGLRRHRAEKPGIEHGVEQPRSPPMMRGEPRRRSHDVGDQPEQAWIGGKQREQLHPGRHLGDHLIEGRKREVGFGGAAERIEQGGQELRQPLARSRAPRGGIAAGLPGADRGDGRLRTAEAKPLERGQRGRVGSHRPSPRCCGADSAQLAAASRTARRNASRRASNSASSASPKSVGVGKARELRDALELVGLGGNDMGLLVADHLQPVLDSAQEQIGFGQLARGFSRDPAACRESSKRLDRPATAKLGMAAAGDQLLGLREELDIADAAAAELDVVPLDRDGAVALIGMHPPLHRVDVGDCRVSRDICAR